MIVAALMAHARNAQADRQKGTALFVVAGDGRPFCTVLRLSRRD
jgi:hypothetical protein